MAVEDTYEAEVVTAMLAEGMALTEDAIVGDLVPVKVQLRARCEMFDAHG